LGETSLSALGVSGVVAESFSHSQADITTLVPGEQETARLQKSTAEWPYLTISDPGREITSGYESIFGFRAPAIFVLCPNQRIVDIAELDTLGDEVSTWINEKITRCVFNASTTRITNIAPVLMVPRALDAEDCDWLVGLWHKGHKVQGQVALGEHAKSRDSINLSFKKREDFILENETIKQKLIDRLIPRILPEIEKVHHFAPSNLESFRIGCYKAESGGFFKVHRDNANPSVKDRKFAITINLNPNEYEGGDLVFPEYGQELYRPDKGGAIIFSCSLLHEVFPVTKGNRFALLTFLF
tara:strand:+ start:1214 stop:2110 length:897 start_codon:yes stop_codon:yes gene_type:complete